MQCPVCGGEMAANADRCASCGAELASVTGAGTPLPDSMPTGHSVQPLSVASVSPTGNVVPTSTPPPYSSTPAFSFTPAGGSSAPTSADGQPPARTTSTTGPLTTGQSFGRYHVIRLLGVGMG